MKKLFCLYYFSHFTIVLPFLLLANKTNAQHDSLILKNGDVIVGEIKSLDKGVVTIETDYSKNDFTIEWSGIKEIYSTSAFLITLTDGTRYNGSFKTQKPKNNIVIKTNYGEQIETSLQDIVFLKGLKSDFWSRADANIDLGVTLTKANNLRQLSVRSAFGYIADKWHLNLYYNDMRSKQDSIAETKRTEGGTNFKYFLQKDWYLSTSVDFLSNTEQALKLRTTGKLGAGNYIVHTNKSYWGIVGGLSYNNESFTNETEKRNSLEGFVGSELNLFDIGDLNLLSSIYIYPSITESGRLRTDFTIDSKYDLPLDFYIKMGITLNYDNKPAVTGNETDYVFVFSVGWEL